MTGTQVAQFEIQEKLGQGGMGVVYKALDTKLNRTVALKFLPQQLSEDETAKARFMQEAQAASSLDHANICTIFEIGETDDGQLFIAMAYYEGQTLKYLMDGTMRPLEQLQSIGRQLSKALIRSHGAGIVHRDIKPANIMLTQHDEIKLLDFGLAKLAGGLDLTVMGSTVGTAAYMSPEQMKGEEVGKAADVWSLGAVLYEMATGRKPFAVDYDQALLYAILNEDPKPVSELNPAIPAPLAGVIDACLRKDPSMRPSIEAVRDMMGDESSSTRSIAAVTDTAAAPMAGPAVRTGPIGLSLQYVIGGVAVVVLAIAGYFMIGGDDNLPAASSSMAVLTQAASPKSVAVLPFAYRGGESTAAFAGGIHDDILAQLSRISDLTVISRTSVMQFQNTTIPISEIATQLGVKNILEGSVQQAGDRVRINTSLIDAQTGVQRWSETYDEELSVENIFAIQSDLSGKIATALEAKMTAEERASLTESANIGVDAYDLFTRAVYKFRNSNSPDAVRESAEMLNRVTQMEPTYVKAYAQLSRVYQRGMDRGVWTRSERGEDARQAAEKAMELDPTLPASLLAMSGTAFDDLNFVEAEDYLKTALSLAPGEASVHSLYANLLYTLGRPQEALEFARKAVSLDPLDIAQRQRLADVYFFIGMYEETITESRKILEMKPDDGWSYYNIGYGMALLGRTTEAIAAFQKAVDLDGEDTVLIMGLAWAHAMAGNKLEAVSIMIDLPDTGTNMKEKAIVYAVLGDLDTAFDLLNRAYESNPGAVAIIAGDDSIPQEMREDPRFQDLLDKLGLESS